MATRLSVLWIIVAGCLISGCASSVEVADVQLKPFGQAVEQVGGSVLVVLTPVVEEYPLQETSWSNQAGAFWNPQARLQSQVESQLDLVHLQSPPPVENNAYTAGDPIDQRITVPMGAMLTTKITDLVKRRFNRVKICPNLQCFVTFRQTARFDKTFQVTIDRFDLWEKPQGYLNLYMKSSLVEQSRPDGEVRTTRHIKEKARIRLTSSPKALRENKPAAVTFFVDQFLDEAIYRVLQAASDTKAN